MTCGKQGRDDAPEQGADEDNPEYYPIEVTPAMIEAAAAVLEAYQGEVSTAFLAKEVALAVELARRYPSKDDRAS